MSTKKTTLSSSCLLNISYSSSAAALVVGNSKDLVGEILSRLPFTSVIRFRLVCKEWCSLTSTQSFIDMYENINHPSPPQCRAAGNNNNNSCFVVQYFKYDSQIINIGKSSNHFNTLFFNLDDNNNDDDNNNSDNAKMKGVREYLRKRGGTNFFHKKRYYHIKLISSYRGFLLFTAKPVAASMSVSARFRRWLTKDEEEEDLALILYNPVTKEQYTVTAPPRTHVYCGFYYHSPTKEYRILYRLALNVVQFLVFGLQTQVMRVLKLQEEHHHSNKIKKSTPTTRRPDVAADAYHYSPDPSTPPVISNGYLHWIVSENKIYHELPHCSHTILCFGMESEEFHLMPHPKLSHGCSPSGVSNNHRHHMNLLEMDGGILCLCDGYYGSRDSTSRPILEIYVMEDYKMWTWVRRYCVDLSNYLQCGCQYGVYYKALQILQGDQLLLHYHPTVWYKHTGVCEEYALYSLNQDGRRPAIASASSNLNQDGRRPAIASASSNITKSTKKKSKRQLFQVLIYIRPGPPGDELIGRVTRMIIKPKKRVRPPIVKGNMVVLTPSLASFQHNRSSTALGTGTFFSIRTNSSYIIKR